jgi:peptidoglycan/xylan/chitin deacetylase (PgdA/CDA1 family)
MQPSAPCLAVMYHYVRDSAATAFPDIRALPPALFREQLDWLQANYTVVDLTALERGLDGGPLAPNPAVLTFDDGFVDHYEAVFPELRARGLSGVFFVSHAASTDRPCMLAVHKTQFLLARLGAKAFAGAVLAECDIPAGRQVGDVFGADSWEAAGDRGIKHLLNYALPFAQAERVLDELFTSHIGDATDFARRLYVSSDMVREMARAGMVFGYHTRTHRMLSRLSDAQQREELAHGVPWIARLTGQSRVPFCYPWGGTQTYNDATVRIVQECGYSLAFNTVRRSLVVGMDSRYELPRLDTRDLPPYTTGLNGWQADSMNGEA